MLRNRSAWGLMGGATIRAEFWRAHGAEFFGERRTDGTEDVFLLSRGIVLMRRRSPTFSRSTRCIPTYFGQRFTVVVLSNQSSRCADRFGTGQRGAGRSGAACGSRSVT